MGIFVYFRDYASGDQCEGLEEVSSRDEAAQFIQRRINGADDVDDDRSIYRVIEGRELRVETVQVRTEIRVV